MEEEIIVHPRIHERHPDLTEDDVLAAWDSCLCSMPRLDKDVDEYLAVGTDKTGRLVEIVAKRIENQKFIIYHAMTPPTKKTLHELKLD